MSLWPLLAVGCLASVAAFVVAGRPAAARMVGIAGLLACFLLAALWPASDRLVIADGGLQLTPYLRLWVATASLTLALLLLVDALAAPADSAPGASWPSVLAPAGVAVMAMALAAEDPAAGVLVLTVGAVLAPLAAMAHEPAAGPHEAVAVLRVVVVSTVLAGLAVAWSADQAAVFEPLLVLGAALAMGAALVLRLGMVPFHLPAARLAELVPRASAPLAVAWLPAAFVVVAGGWATTSLAAAPETLGPVREIVVGGTLVTLAAGTLAMLAQDDLAHLLGYAILQDASLGLLALVALQPPGSIAVREWLLVFAAGKTAAAGLVIGLERTFATRRMGALDGWLRRAPLLGVVLLIVIVVTYGLPGTLVFGARWQLVSDVAGYGPAVAGLTLAALSGLAWLHLGLVGLRPVGVAVSEGRSARPRWPRATSNGGALEVTEAAQADPPEATSSGEPISAGSLHAAGLGSGVSSLAAALRLDQVPLAHLAALLLALVPLALALGLGGLAAAAGGPPPIAPGSAN